MSEQKKPTNAQDDWDDEESGWDEPVKTEPGWQTALKALAKSAADWKTQKDRQIVRALTFDQIDPANLPLLGKGIREGENSLPGKVGGLTGYLSGSAAGGYLTGMGLAKYFPAMQKTAAMRQTLQAGAAAAEGALRDPGQGEDRATNAVKNAGLSVLLGGGLESLMQYNPQMFRTLGRVFGNLSKEEAAIRRSDPEFSDIISSKSRKQPDTLNQELQQIFEGERTLGSYGEGALSRVTENYIDPRKAKKNAILSRFGVNASFPADEFKGASPAVQDYISRVSLTRGVPLRKEIIETKPGDLLNITPETFFYPANQKGLSIRYPGYKLKKAMYPSQQSKGSGEYMPKKTISDLDEKIPGAEFEQQTAFTDLRMPPKKTSTFVPDPNAKIILTPQQQSDLMEIAGSNAYSKARKIGQVMFDPVQEAFAQADANVFSKVRKAQEMGSFEKQRKNLGSKYFSLEGETSPLERQRIRLEQLRNPRSYKESDINALDLPQLNDEMSDALDYVNYVKNLGNTKSTILTAGDSTPGKSIRRFFDKKAGTKLEKMALALSAGNKLSTDRATSNVKSFPLRGLSDYLINRRNFTPAEKTPINFAALETLLNIKRPRQASSLDDDISDWDE